MNEIADKVQEILDDLKKDIQLNMVKRDKVASGETFRSIRSTVLSSEFFVRGSGSATDNWVNVGSGTPPGSGVTPKTILEWLNSRGLQGMRRAALPIARKINKLGSKDYRLKRENVFTEVIDRYSQEGRFNIVDEAADYVQEVIVPPLRELERI